MRLDKTAQSVTCLWRQTVLCAAFCLTNSTEHERSWEATSSSSRPATPPLSQQIYVIRRISTYTQEPTILSVLSQINLVNTLPCPFNIFLHLLLVLSSCLCTAPFPTNPCTSLLQNTILKHWTSPRIQQMRFAILTPFFLSSRKPSRFIKYATSYCCKINFFSVANRFIPTKCCQTASNTISCQHSSQYHLLSTQLSIPSPFNTAPNTISCQHSSQYHLLSTQLSIPPPVNTAPNTISCQHTSQYHLLICLIKKAPWSELLDSRQKLLRTELLTCYSFCVYSYEKLRVSPIVHIRKMRRKNLTCHCYGKRCWISATGWLLTSWVKVLDFSYRTIANTLGKSPGFQLQDDC